MYPKKKKKATTRPIFLCFSRQKWASELNESVDGGWSLRVGDGSPPPLPALYARAGWLAAAFFSLHCIFFRSRQSLHSTFFHLLQQPTDQPTPLCSLYSLLDALLHVECDEPVSPGGGVAGQRVPSDAMRPEPLAAIERQRRRAAPSAAPLARRVRIGRTDQTRPSHWPGHFDEFITTPRGVKPAPAKRPFSGPPGPLGDPDPPEPMGSLPAIRPAALRGAVGAPNRRNPRRRQPAEGRAGRRAAAAAAAEASGTRCESDVYVLGAAVVVRLLASGRPFPDTVSACVSPHFGFIADVVDFSRPCWCSLGRRRPATPPCAADGDVPNWNERGGSSCGGGGPAPGKSSLPALIQGPRRRVDWPSSRPPRGAREWWPCDGFAMCGVAMARGAKVAGDRWAWGWVPRREAPARFFEGPRRVRITRGVLLVGVNIWG